MATAPYTELRRPNKKGRSGCRGLTSARWRLFALVPAVGLRAGQLILEFQFLALQSCDVEIVAAGMAQFILYLPIEVAVTPLQRLDVAFGRLDTSFSWFGRLNRHKKFTRCRRGKGATPGAAWKTECKAIADRARLSFGHKQTPIRGLRTATMLPLTKEQEAALGLELAGKRQEHADLDAAIHTLSTSGYGDQMLIQRMKKRKLALKDRIVQLENILLPDIIA